MKKDRLITLAVVGYGFMFMAGITLGVWFCTTVHSQKWIADFFFLFIFGIGFGTLYIIETNKGRK